MPSTPGLSFKKPVSIWHKPLKLNFKDFFKALGNAGVDAATGQWAGLGKDAVSVLTAIGLDTSNPGELAWALIYNAMTSAIGSLLEESELPNKTVQKGLRQLPEILDETLNDAELKIETDFFKQPKQLDIVSIMQGTLQYWLEDAGTSELHAKLLSRRLPTCFVVELNREWHQRSQDYAQIKRYVESPFAVATLIEHGWGLYNAWLQKQIEVPMMLEAFGLADVYIPLRGYFHQDSDDREQIYRKLNCSTESNINEIKKTQRVVVDLATTLNDWIDKADTNDAIRVVSGGPGCGKSSFAKVFAAQHTLTHAFPVLFIPLHQLNLEVTTDFIEAVENFISYDLHLQKNPLDPKDNALRLLVILDGLDELALQGKLAQDTAHAFIREIVSQVDAFNRVKMRLQIIITGREIAIQETFRDSTPVLHVLPYRIASGDYKRSSEKSYIGKDSLIIQDQRIDWWKKYGQAIQVDYPKLPQQIQTKELKEITAQPLLNYLVAMSYTKGKLTESDNANLNLIYAALVEEVYKRGYEGNRKHAAIRQMRQQDFLRILEEVGLSAWHGHGRTTTVKEIEDHCSNSRLKRLFEVFQEGAREGVTRLLTAFYFQQSGVRSDEQTFEFTHKSFGEYLTARRIVRAVEKIQKALDARSQGMEDGWDEPQALAHWATICGPTPMDTYLLSFLRNEVALRSIEQVSQWQATFSHLIGFMLQRGMPMEKIDPRMKFSLKNRWARNSEEALLAVLNACAQKTQRLSRVKWPTPQACGAWITWLQGEKSAETETTVALQSLSWLDLSNSILDFRDLYGANLECVNLRNAGLYGTHLATATLKNANLTNACLKRAILDNTCLEGAQLNESVLEEATLNGASLQKADLTGAILDGAISKKATLDGATLNETSLRCVKFTNTSFAHVHLESADMSEAYLDSANFSWAKLNDCNLDGAHLDGATFVETNLDGACLDGASCRGTSWIGAVLSHATLDGAILDGASFYGAVLDDAVLDHASLQCARLTGARLLGTSLLSTSLTHTNFELANLGGVAWNADTQMSDISGIDKAVNVPILLQEQVNRSHEVQPD